MDRVELSQKDLDDLLEWRDAHKDLVRSMPAPLKSVEIVFKHNSYRIVGIRNGDKLKLQLFVGYESLGWAEFVYDRFLRRLIGKKSKLKISQESFQAVLTVYSSLMALMVYGNESSDYSLETTVMQYDSHKATQRATHATSNRNTYILKKTKRGLQAILRGSHAKPSGVFTVRGHYRRYKSGKVIWIDTYKKGTGKNKPKTYKIGGMPNDDGKAV